ncbi:hypothetical protein GF361_01170 [Candidatus Woesearchaeota archaeon]|nr:hypothetical protein [Candidatus Woesearchaeota archaeon]
MKVYKIGNKGCHECTIMVPRWKKIEEEMPELKTEYYEASENPDLVKKYNINEIPTFLFLDNKGNELSRLAKIQPKEKLLEEIKKHKDK